MDETRRSFLKTACLLGAAAAAPVAAPPDVMAQPKPAQPPGLRVRSREEVGYQDEPYLGRTCGKCVLYQGDGKCVILSEAVSPTGWCKQWVPITMG
jgi:hypothetical protein